MNNFDQNTRDALFRAASNSVKYLFETKDYEAIGAGFLNFYAKFKNNEAFKNFAACTSFLKVTGCTPFIINLQSFEHNNKVILPHTIFMARSSDLDLSSWEDVLIIDKEDDNQQVPNADQIEAEYLSYIETWENSPELYLYDIESFGQLLYTVVNPIYKKQSNRKTMLIGVLIVLLYETLFSTNSECFHANFTDVKIDKQSVGDWSFRISKIDFMGLTVSDVNISMNPMDPGFSDFISDKTKKVTQVTYTIVGNKIVDANFKGTNI